MVFVVIGVLLLVMKITEVGFAASWSWLAVLAPFGCAVVWWWFADTTGWTKQREINKMEDKKRQRRIDALDNLGMDHKGRRGRSESAKRARRRT